MAKRVRMITIKIPVVEAPESQQDEGKRRYWSSHIDIQLHGQFAGLRRTMRAIQDGLEATPARASRLAGNGRPVASSGDVVRWILEQIQAGIADPKAGKGGGGGAEDPQI